jgi:hypothetical protein
MTCLRIALSYLDELLAWRMQRDRGARKMMNSYEAGMADAAELLYQRMRPGLPARLTQGRCCFRTGAQDGNVFYCQAEARL